MSSRLLTEPRRFRGAVGRFTAGLDDDSDAMSSSFTLREMGAVILARVGPATSTARCVLQAAPIADGEPWDRLADLSDGPARGRKTTTTRQGGIANLAAIVHFSEDRVS